MTGPPEMTPESFEILVVRELRKVGFEVFGVRGRRRADLPPPSTGFLLELLIGLGRPGGRKQVLASCRCRDVPIGPEAVESLKERLPAAGAQAALLFGTADFTPDALSAGLQNGIALFRIVDGRSAFDAAGWGPSGHYPAWLPAYLAELLDRDPAGLPRRRLLETGGAGMIPE